MKALRLLGVLLLMGLVAPAGWLATAQPATAEEGGGEGEAGEAGSDAAEATEEPEDEAARRARAANAPPGNPFQGVPADPWQEVTGSAAPSSVVTISPPGGY
jgi:hypothetical protein